MNFNSSLDLSSSLLFLVLAVSFVLFVLFIFVSISIIHISRDLKRLVDLEFKKFNAGKKEIQDVGEDPS